MGKHTASQVSVNPAPGSSTRADIVPDPPLREDSDDVSIMNSEVKSVMNHRRLKEAMHALVFTKQEITALSSMDAYI